MLTVTICEDDGLAQAFATKVIEKSSGVVLERCFNHHLELFNNLRDGYRTDIYVIDCLLYGESRNYGYELVRELASMQQDALIVIMSQKDSNLVRRDLTQYRIQSVLNKSAAEDLSTLLAQTMIALSRGLRSDNPAIDVYELLTKNPINQSKMDSFGINSELKRVFESLLVVWHIRDAAIAADFSDFSYRLKLVELCEVLGINSAHPMHSLWRFAMDNDLWDAKRHIEQRNISLDGLKELTQQEREVLLRVTRDESKESIAQSFGMSVPTVYSRIQSIKSKTGAKQAVDLWVLGHFLEEQESA